MELNSNSISCLVARKAASEQKQIVLMFYFLTTSLDTRGIIYFVRTSLFTMHFTILELADPLIGLYVQQVPAGLFGHITTDNVEFFSLFL